MLERDAATGDMSVRDVHGDRNCTHPHGFHFHRHPSPHNIIFNAGRPHRAFLCCNLMWSRSAGSAQVRYAEASMRNGFGLKYIYKFFNLPFLCLQVTKMFIKITVLVIVRSVLLVFR